MSNKSNQTTRFCRAIIFAFTAFFALTVFASAQSKTSTAHLHKEHAKALQTWLKANPKYRAAQVSDCKNKSGLNSMRGDNPKFHPFYAIYDFDKDENRDFAVAVINPTRRADSQFKVLIFKNDGKNAFKVFHTIDGADLRQGGIWIVDLEEGVANLYYGEFETDNCSYLAWENKKLVVRDCEGN